MSATAFALVLIGGQALVTLGPIPQGVDYCRKDVKPVIDKVAHDPHIREQAQNFLRERGLKISANAPVQIRCVTDTPPTILGTLTLEQALQHK